MYWCKSQTLVGNRCKQSFFLTIHPPPKFPPQFSSEYTRDALSSSTKTNLHCPTFCHQFQTMSHHTLPLKASATLSAHTALSTSFLPLTSHFLSCRNGGITPKEAFLRPTTNSAGSIAPSLTQHQQMNSTSTSSDRIGYPPTFQSTTLTYSHPQSRTFLTSRDHFAHPPETHLSLLIVFPSITSPTLYSLSYKT